ncbi:Crossover junction endonuclease EME1 [Portunus trituberculatus]|uniref:Crossover junction endonuclease EME1 n=1 Tax=Portunus trituberculatus TaxID=210409 RepID=A0A5B7DC73_PORTR|nr:Crossover junction endonuclease EME1 [Portunus trituberculatus]
MYIVYVNVVTFARVSVIQHGLADHVLESWRWTGESLELIMTNAYRQCGSQREAELLLADLRVRRGVGPLVSEKRVGPEFSRKVHLFFTSRDPDAHLANT